MSAGPVYISTVNDGSMDELLFMNAVLKTRMDEIKASRTQLLQDLTMRGANTAGFALTPTLADISQTHSVLPYKAYKPYVPTQFQYTKTRPGTGATAVGGECTFTQQTFGEFICDSFLMFETNTLTGTTVDLRDFIVTNQATLLPPNTLSVNGGAATTPANFLASIADTQLTASASHVITTYHIEDALGNVLIERSKVATVGTITTELAAAYTSAITVRDYVHYADFPAHALIERVAFSITNNEFDFYTQERDNFYLLYQVCEDKKDSYYKCIGQELPIKGASGLITNFTPDVGVYPSSAAQGGIISARQQISVLAGYQTPKFQQPGLLCMYPNKFDHCRHVSNSLPILAITHADRQFTYKFRPQDKVVFTSDANLRSVKTTLTTLTNANKEFLTAKTTVEATPFKVGSTIPSMTFSSLAMYVNNVFIDPSIHQIYLERIGFCITRVHRTYSSNVNVSELDLTLNTFKWPLEYMFVGLRPSTNLTTNPQRNWWKFSYNVETIGNSYAQSNSLLASGMYNATVGTGEFYVQQRSLASAQRIVYDIEAPTIVNFSVSLQTIVLYENQNAAFYNAYLPFALGGKNIRGPAESSTLFIPFTFTAGSNDELGGHVNLSRSREFTIKFTSNIIGSGNVVSSGVFHSVGIVINFWIVSSGNLYLRFT